MLTNSSSDCLDGEAEMACFFEEAPLPYQSLDENARFIAVNQAWEEYLGYRRDDVQGRLMAEFLVPGQEDKLKRAFDLFLQSDAIRGISLAFKCNDGTHKVALIHGRIARDHRGGFNGTRCILYDITEQKALAAALRRSEESYRLAMEAVQDGVWDWDVQSGQVQYSKGWSRILGEEEMDGIKTFSTWVERIHPDDKPKMLETLDAHLDRKTAEWSGEHRLRHANGSWLWVIGRGRVVARDQDGQPLRMIGTMTDINERKLAEIGLRKSERKHRVLFNSVDESILVFGSDGACELANAAAAQLFRLAPEDMTGKTLSDLYQAHGDTFAKRIENAIATGTVHECEDLLSISHEKRWLYSRVYPVPEGEGNCRSALVISLDITERRRIEEALRESESRLKALINATADDVVVLLNEEMRMEIANERAALGFGRALEELIGQPIGKFMPAEIAEERRAHAREVLSTGRTVRFEDQRAGRWYDNNMCPVLDQRGKATAVAIFARDITERRGMEMRLAKAKEEAESANAAKSHFLAAANHDLRQPLHASTLLVEALLARDLDPEARRLVIHIKEATRLMEKMLSGLLDIGKLEAGSFRPKKVRFSAERFLYDLRQQFRMTAQEAGTRLRVAAPHTTLYTDPLLLSRIVQNFVSNAIRHARGGSVLIVCRRASGGRRIEVWDDGIGIAPDQQERVFEKFYQVGPSRSREEQGLGLGLSIAKGMSELLGVEIGMRSTEGKGSVFYVTVPVAEKEDEVAPREDTATGWPKIGGGWVLVVDDNRVVLEATKNLLDSAGYQVSCAETAEDALALVAERPASLRLALLDFRLLEGWDGIQLAQRLCSDLDRKLPVILVTGDTAVGRLREVQLSGLPMLNKPVAPDDLQKAMRDVLSA
jgi:PAS domain S-box-containing protein